MKLKLFVMSMMAMVGGLLGCQAQTQGFKSLSVEEFAEAIADTSVVRLDVRTAQEYADGHLEGARNLDVLQADFEQRAVKELPKDKTIALYCRSGRRSKQAAGILAKQGYQVLELNTGYLGWTGAGKKVVK